MIRVNDKNGRTVRESIFPIGDDKEWSGLQLSMARDIARNRIRELKGIEEPPTFRERMQKKWIPRLKEMSFDELVELAIEVQRRSTKSEQYVDDNWSRYTAYASPAFGLKKAIDVTAEDIFAVLVSLDSKPAQKRNLHSFLSYTLNLAWDLSPDFRVTAVGIRRDCNRDFGIYRKEEYLYDGRHELEVSDFDQLFKILENETVHIQKAHFVHLLFLFGPQISPRKLMAAKTNDFYITDIIKTRGLWGEKEEEHQYVYWRPKFKRKKYFEYRIQDEQIEVLRRIVARNKTEFPNSVFLFLSGRSPKSGHMTSFMDYWDKLKSRTNLPNMSLKKLIGNYMWACNERFKVYDPDTIDFDDG